MRSGFSRKRVVMDRKQSCLPEVEKHVSDAIPAKAQGLKDLPVPFQKDQQLDAEQEKHYLVMSPYPRKLPPGMGYDDFRKDIRRDNRYARYEAVRTLYQQGITESEISRRLKLCRQTITTYIEAKVFPEM